MKKRVLGWIAASLVAAPMVASALPIQYDVTYGATTGPSGVGSFVFDQDNGAMSDFRWDFGGTIGGISDVHFDWNPLGDTLGRLVFELLTYTDVHSGADCTHGGCSWSTSVTVGSAPLDASEFILSNTASGANFAFLQYSDVLVTGSVTLARNSQVPEPATLAIFGVGLLGVGVARRFAKQRVT